jgi:hypothetical protein
MFSSGFARNLAHGPDPWLGLLVPLATLNWLTQLGATVTLGVLLPSTVLVIPFACSLGINTKLSYEAGRRPGLWNNLLAVSVLGVSATTDATTGMKQEILFPELAAFASLMLAVRRSIRPWHRHSPISMRMANLVAFGWNASSSGTRSLHACGRITNGSLGMERDRHALFNAV